MKFLCLCHYNLEQFSKFTPVQFQQMGVLCAPHDKALADTGKVLAIGSLATPDAFRSIRARKGEALVTQDAPYAQTAEPFGAFFIIEATDMEDATRLAKLHPSTHLAELCDGGIEIRPIEFVRFPAAAP